MPCVLGIDEAGRGPILGPLVVAGVYWEETDKRALVRLGVQDSKRFAGPSAKSRRAEVALAIRARAVKVVLKVLSPAEVDAENLGDLERRAACAIIEEVGPEGDVYADGRPIFGRLRKRYERLVAEDRAEMKYFSVAAASIVAKVERDRLFDEIRSRYEPDFGPIAGGGYLNDATRGFLAAYKKRFGDLPPEARRKWNLRPLE